MTAKNIYCISVEDLQNVAMNEYGRKLSPNELKQVAEKIGDYFPDWYEKVDYALFNILNLKENV